MLKKAFHFDYVIIGAGIQGLAIAYHLTRIPPGATVCVVESSASLGNNASTQNSGVLHAGIYYAPGSKKAEMAVNGNRSMAQFCEENEVPFERCGKLIVPANEAELEGLERLHARGVSNGVQLEIVDSKRIMDINPLANSRLNALWSPNTGVADPQAMLTIMEKALKAKGVAFKLGTLVSEVNGSKVVTAGGQVIVAEKGTVNAAGPGSLILAKRAGLAKELALTPFKGRYRKAKVDTPTHIYPVPNPDLPFLGVHASRTLRGITKIGPTATPTINFRRVTSKDSSDRQELFSSILGFARYTSRSPLTAAKTLADELRVTDPRQMLRDLQKIAPGIKQFSSAKMIQGPTRSQLVNLRTGELVDDFMTVREGNNLHLLNSVSPGWTTAFETGAEVVKMLGESE